MVSLKTVAPRTVSRLSRRTHERVTVSLLSWQASLKATASRPPWKAARFTRAGPVGIATPARPIDAPWSALAGQTGLLVEDRLFDLHADGQRELYSAYLAALRHDSGGVFAVGPDMLRAPQEVRRQLAALDVPWTALWQPAS